MLNFIIDVSVIIVNYNTTELTKLCIESIFDYTLLNTYEIIVVDNASDDKSILSIAKFYQNVILISNTENVGFGRANNYGINIAKGKYVFLLNSDAFLTSDAIAEFWAYMENEEHSNVACCGGELVDQNFQPVESYGNFPSVLEAFSSIGFAIFYKKHYKRYIHSGVVNFSQITRDVDFLCGADMFIRKSILFLSGAFDPDFFLYFEETELSFRFSKNGYKSVILPYIKIIHIGGESQKSNEKININKLKFFFESRNKYFLKVHGKKTAILVKSIYIFKALIWFMLSFNSKYKKIAILIYKS